MLKLLHNSGHFTTNNTFAYNYPIGIQKVINLTLRIRKTFILLIIYCDCTNASVAVLCQLLHKQLKNANLTMLHSLLSGTIDDNLALMYHAHLASLTRIVACLVGT